MDTLLYSVLRITVMVLILRTIFRMFQMPRGNTFRFKQNDKTDQVPDHSPSSTEKPSQTNTPIEMVRDKFSQIEIPRHEAYILMDENDEYHYFSAWESRQQFIDAHLS